MRHRLEAADRLAELLPARRRSSRHCSSCRRIVPTDAARIIPRSQSIASLKTAIPAPAVPSSVSAATSQSSKKSSPIGDDCRPIFASGGPTVRPGESRSTQERAQPSESEPRIRGREDDEEIALGRVRHERLRTVEDPSVASVDRGCPERERV